MRRKLLLIQRKKAARRRDALNAFFDQFIGRIGKELKQVTVIQRIDDLVGHCAAHDLILHRERPSLRVADVAVEPFELAVEHQDADGHTVVRAPMFRSFHPGGTSMLRARIAADASAASNSPVSRCSSGCDRAKRSMAKASIGILDAPSSMISAIV